MSLRNILVFNSGSSSFKVSLFHLEEANSAEPVEPVFERDFSWEQELSRHDQIERAIQDIRSQPVEVVGHRVVHGGVEFSQPTEIDAAVKKEIAKLAPLAPEHNPINLEGIEIGQKLYPQARHFAVFDTAYHRSLPPEAAIYPGPYSWFEDLGIRRFGFHGISHSYIAARSAQLLKRDPGKLKLISCHLGNGASLCAIRGGRSIDTTMGFTPLDGLMMGSRSGALDPGILIHLLKQRIVSLEELDEMLNEKSGLKGISQLSNDMREIFAALQAGNEKARLASQMYLHSLIRNIGWMLAGLEGTDAIAFTGGIGEHMSDIRSGVCKALSFTGLQLDEEANRAVATDMDIAAAESKVRVLVIAARENWWIARACCEASGCSSK